MKTFISQLSINKPSLLLSVLPWLDDSQTDEVLGQDTDPSLELQASSKDSRH